MFSECLRTRGGCGVSLLAQDDCAQLGVHLVRVRPCSLLCLIPDQAISTPLDPMRDSGCEAFPLCLTPDTKIWSAALIIPKLEDTMHISPCVYAEVSQMLTLGSSQ
jgi:hypothetical protein